MDEQFDGIESVWLGFLKQEAQRTESNQLRVLKSASVNKFSGIFGREMDMKIIFLIFCLQQLISPSTQSKTADCELNYNWSYQIVGQIYKCKVKNNINITSYEEAGISSITGTHVSRYNNGHVVGFDIRGKTVQYFPRDFNKRFAAMQLIIIQDCRLKQVNQTDLQPFPSLNVLDLEGNEIEILEEGIFDYNPKLQWVSLAYNKILHADLNIFDKLGSLTTLNFASNKCLSADIADSSAAVKLLIVEIKDACQDSNYLRLNNTIKAVQKDMQTVKLKSFRKFSVKLYDLENDFKNSEWKNFPRFVEDIHNLTNHKKFLDLENLYAINSRINEVEVKDMPQRVEDIEKELSDFDVTAGDEIEQKIEEMDEKLEKFKDKFSAWMTKINNKLSEVNLDEDMENLTEFGRDINVLGKKIMRKFDRKMNGLEKRLSNRI